MAECPKCLNTGEFSRGRENMLRLPAFSREAIREAGLSIHSGGAMDLATQATEGSLSWE